MSYCPENVIDSGLLVSPSRRRRAAEAEFVLGPDGNQRMVMGSSRKPKEYANCDDMLYSMGLCFQNGGTVDFTGCYTVDNSPPVSDKERVRTLINDIWLTTGYRFTVKDHPPIQDGHKTRLWCSQDEARRCKNKSRSKDKDAVDADGYPLPRYNLSGDPMAKSRFPCKSRLWITSRDKPSNNRQESALPASTTAVRVVTVRIYHQHTHEKYNQGAFITKDTSQISFLPFKPALPPHLSFQLPQSVVATEDQSRLDEVSDEEEDENSDDLDLSMMREEQSSAATSVPESEDQMTPELFQRKMRAHISNIREFCSGLEYQLQFNDFRLLGQLESEGERFLSLVKHCLEAEGRLAEYNRTRIPSTIMETQFAITGKGYVIVASDTTAARSIVKMKSDEDKIKVLGPNLLMAYSGEPGDTVQFAEFIERNIRLYQIRNTYPLRPPAAASWIRRELAQSIRSRHPYSVNLLLGGYDQTSSTPQLYWMDYLGTLTEVPFASHGYGSYFALGLLDRYHDPEANLEEGLATLRRCIDEVARRLVVSPGKYKVKVVDRDGVREVEL